MGFSTASPEPKEKEQGSATENNSVKSGDAKASDTVEDTGRTEVNDQTKESGFDSEPRFTILNLSKEVEELLNKLHFSIQIQKVRVIYQGRI